MKKLFLYISLFLILLNFASAETSAELKKMYSEANDTNDKIDILGNLAVAYCDIHIDSAKLYADSMRRMSKSSNLELKCRAYSVSGYVYERMGIYEDALKYQLYALKLSFKTKNNKLISNCHNGVGVMYDYMGDYDKALEYYFKGYRIRKKDNDTIGMQQSLGNIGLAFHLKGDFNNALKYLFESLKLGQVNEDASGYTSALNNIAMVFQQQKNYEKALEYYEKCLKLYLKNNQKFDIALAYNNIGSVYLDKAEYEKSIYYHQKSLEIKEEIGDSQGKVMSYHNLGSIYNQLNKLDTALIYLKKGEAILKVLPDKASEIELSNTMASVYFKLNDTKTALRYLQRSLEIYDLGTEYYKIYETYKNMSEVQYALGNYKSAADYLGYYWNMIDSIQNNENSKLLQQKELEDQYLLKKRTDEITKKKEEEKERIEKEAEAKQNFLWRILAGSIFIGLLIIIIVISRNYNEKKKANNLLSERNNVISLQNNEIKKQSVLLEEKNRDITDSIQYAKRLQDAILPDIQDRMRLMKDHFILYKPKDIVSGDFYWLHDLSKGNEWKYLFAVVDCTGHGVPGGFVSIVGNNSLNRAVNEFGLTKPSEILDKVSDLVEESFDSNNEEIRDGMDMSLIAITKNNGKIALEYAGANNPIWIVKNNDQNILELKADKRPIGKYEFKKPFSNSYYELSEGDCVYLFSDGYADQFGGPSGKKFKYSQLKEKLVSMMNKNMEWQEKELQQAILNWRGELEQIDDICIAGIKL